MTNPTAKQIRDRLAYYPETGVFLWRERGLDSGFSPEQCAYFNRRWAGTAAGKIDTTGYRQIRIGGRVYMAHRLAWTLMTGASPELEIDHINAVRDDNRWINLRHVDRATNVQNRRAVTRAKRASRFIGVQPHGNKWRADIGFGGKRSGSVGASKKYLGLFDTEEEAAYVYLSAKRRLHEGATI